MEHAIKTHEFVKFNNRLNEQPTSETPMIIREMMIYNRHLVEENIMLGAEVKRLEMEIQRLNSFKVVPEENPTVIIDNLRTEMEILELHTQIETQDESSLVSNLSSNGKKQSKGTQIYIDPAIATTFTRQLRDSGYKLSDVCRAMMAICLERPRYRNMIFDRVKNSERISNVERETTSFAFTYPIDLGTNFSALLRSHRIKQYEFFEQMFKEFVQSYSFRKLLPAYIHQIKQK